MLKRFYPVGKKWNPNAIDYSQGINITDCITGKVFSEEEANKQPKEIKERLVNKGKVIGCWVVREWIDTKNYLP